MMRSPLLDLHTLSARMIVSFVVVIVVTMLAIGVPTLWVVGGELERQGWARVDQAAGATDALYAARLRELQMLATLTAERPTLRRLLEQRDEAALPAYLEEIRTTAQLDLLALLDSAGALVAHAELPTGWDDGIPSPLIVVRAGATPGLIELGGGGASGLAIQAVAPVLDEDGTAIGTVVEGMLVDESFLSTLREETGVHHSLFQNGVRVATTLPGLPGRLQDGGEQVLRWAGGEPFYTRSLPLDVEASTAVDLLALPAREIVATQARVRRVLVGSTLLVAGLGAVLAYLLSRRITLPLNRLVTASEGIGRGDLDTPIGQGDSITEVTSLARTLEQMRRRLQTAYDDLRRSKAWSENLIASLSEGVLTVDAAGRITSFSPGAERILGWRAVDVIGRHHETIFGQAAERDGVSAGGQQGTGALQTAPGSMTRRTVSTREGRPIVLLLTSGDVTTRNGGQWEQAYVFRDVTEEEAALRMREFFLANVSHEFKTPLSALRAAVELLAGDLATLSGAELRELVDSIWLGTLRLEELVDNLLSSASIQTGHFEVRPRSTDLESAIEEVHLATRALLAPRGQPLMLALSPALPPVYADPRRLSQVLFNLISNASKFAPTGTPITIEAEERAEAVVVRVSDRGPGIADDVRAQLFQPFRRSDEQNRAGVGLGLSIVKAIIERHGGEVGVESAAGQGATFWFTLPTVKRTMHENPGRG